jgi:riboflavin-specific deaminase-like protein
MDRSGRLVAVDARDPRALLLWDPQLGWRPGRDLSSEVRDLLDLYLPVVGGGPRETRTIGHLGQSLDGCIATKSGDSCYVTGPENILHLHRMRALCDAVVVGAETVASDDPRLTTRLVVGDNPVRVILDPRGRLTRGHRVFTDAEAPTLLICSADPGGATHGADVVRMDMIDPRARLDLDAVLRVLHERGLRRVFVEGGGVTVSAFLQSGLLDRLQIAIAPVVIGDGRRGLQLPQTETMGDCLRPPCRIFSMGSDLLFDCETGRRRHSAPQDRGAPDASVKRIL